MQHSEIDRVVQSKKKEKITQRQNKSVYLYCSANFITSRQSLSKQLLALMLSIQYDVKSATFGAMDPKG